MNDFLTNIGSIYWWLSVVVVGILINLISAYLNKKLDVRLSKLSSWWKKRSETKKQKRALDLSRLRNNEHEQMMMALRELRHRSRSLMFLLFGVLLLMGVPMIEQPNVDKSSTAGIFLGLFRLVLMLFGAVCVLRGYQAHNDAIYVWGLLIDSQSKSDNETESTAT